MPITKIITQHIQRYPKMQIQDLYKLLFQAAMGIEHLLQNPTPILDYLLRELAAVESAPPTLLAEPISPELVRVHLGPFKARKGQPAQLVELMFKTAQNFQPSGEMFQIYWSRLEEMADKKMIPFLPAELQAFFRPKQVASFPAAHHSQIFRENYRPAYRVMMKKFLVELQLTA